MNTMRTFDNLQALDAALGETVGPSDWVTVTQEQVNRFAEATGDHQWIHVDVERARSGPFGTTVAHGFFTLSLLPRFMESAFEVLGVRMGLNYGLNRVRFTDPVPVGSRLRASLQLQAVEALEQGGRQLCWAVTVEREGGAKPVCVAEALVRLYP
jgi:acyl dehydratase